MSREPRTREEAIQDFIRENRELKEQVEASGENGTLMSDFRPLLEKLWQAGFDRGRAHEKI